MPSTQQQNRVRFKTTQDWYNFLTVKNPTHSDLLRIRKKCYEDIEQYRKRPLLIYATKFLEKTLPDAPNFIDLSDVDGFNDMIVSVKNSSSIKDSDVVDVLLHSPGGRPDATERIVELLRGHLTIYTS